MKLIGNNGEVLAEFVPAAGKRNIYCHGGFGLMLTRRALERCTRADDVETLDMFKAPDPVPSAKQVEADDVPEGVVAIDLKKEDVSRLHNVLGYFFGD